jgi:hypothetical protein
MRLLFACMLLATLSSTVFSQPVQKWVDDKGKVHYGTPPPGTATQPLTKGTVSAGSANSRNTAQKSTGTAKAPSGAPSAPGGVAAISQQQYQNLDREVERAKQDAQINKRR